MESDNQNTIPLRLRVFYQKAHTSLEYLRVNLYNCLLSYAGNADWDVYKQTNKGTLIFLCAAIKLPTSKPPPKSFNSQSGSPTLGEVSVSPVMGKPS